MKLEFLDLSLSLNINWSNKNATKDLLKSDYVIVDAPCSGTGVLGKNWILDGEEKNASHLLHYIAKILKNISKL